MGDVFLTYDSDPVSKWPYHYDYCQFLLTTGYGTAVVIIKHMH